MARFDRNKLFVTGGFKHFRRTYSLAEVRAGLVVLLVLVALTVWIGWRGTLRPAELYGEIALASAEAEPSVGGPLPAPLLEDDWVETERSQFDESNLYEKINGRADFFTSKGFVKLTFVALVNDTLTLDVELYDMGSEAGALSAFTAERREGTEVSDNGSSQHYLARNALYLTKGKHYARVLGSDESAASHAALEAIRSRLEDALSGGDRPWALELFASQGIAAGDVTYVESRAFSLEAVSHVWLASVGGDTELFISVRTSADDAAAIADAITDGFASYGARLAQQPALVVDDFLKSVSGALAHGEFVIGVRAAADAAAANAAIDRLRAAIVAMPAPLRDRARAAAKEPPTPIGSEEGEP